MPIPGRPGVSAEDLRLFCALLCMPGSDALEILQSQAAEHEWLTPAVSELQATPLDRWQGEYTRLFVSGYPQTVCPPYASAYLSNTMQGPATRDLERFYARLGLTSTQMPADYLGSMLECAAFLLEQEGAEAERLSAEIWGEHLHKWLPRFAADLRGQSRLILYSVLGQRLGSLGMPQS